MEETKKTNKFISGIKAAASSVIEMFKDYPITLISILAIAVLLMIGVDSDFSKETEKIIENTMIFLTMFAAVSLFCEEFFGRIFCNSERRISVLWEALIYIAGIGNAFLGSFYARLIEEENVLSETVFCICATVCVCLAIVSVYHMYRRLEVDFEMYCLKVFCGCVKCVCVYGLFAVGIAIIVFIFETLICDTGSFLSRVEMFLAAGIYSPMFLSCFAKKQEDAGKFSKVVFLYVLEPMMLIAFVIIYIYIFKIIINQKLPSNEVFEILAFMFALGMPVWTIEQAFNETEYENKLSVIAKYVPFAFIPFIILQIICVSLRISDYGITEDRYYGVALIVFEVLYFAFYIIQFLRKNNEVSFTLLAACVMIIVMFDLPGINIYDASVNSQMKRLEVMISDKNPSNSQKINILDTYRAIEGIGVRGDHALETRIPKEARDIIETYRENEYDYKFDGTLRYYFENNIKESVDLTGYSKLIFVEGFGGDSKEVYTVTDSETGVKIDVSNVLSQIISIMDGCENNEAISSRLYSIDADRDIFIKDGYIEISEDTKEIVDYSLDGFLLIK